MLNTLRQDFRTLLGIGVILLGLSFIIGYVTERPPTVGEVQPTFLKGNHSPPKAQPTVNRIWKEYVFESLLNINHTLVTRPVIIRADTIGNIYLLDWADFQIKMFSPDGNLLNTFGEGQGRTPGGFLNPTGFSVIPDGGLWVCDPPQQRIIRFNAMGIVTQTILPQSPVEQIAAVGNELVTMIAPIGKALFEIYSLSGELLRSFGEIIEDQHEYGIALDGHVVGDEEARGFVYGGRRVGIIAGYGIDGEQRFLVHTIDGVPLPKVLVIDQRRKIKPKGPRSALSMSIMGEQLYVLSGTRAASAGDVEVQVMDVYNKRDGAYLFSFKLPIACKKAIVQSDRIYTLSTDEVTVWHFGPEA